MNLKSILIATFVFVNAAYADPAPFGLEIGKASLSDVKAKYATKYTGVNKYNHGEMYDLDVSELSFDGLQSASLVFNEKGKLQAVLCTLQKEKFKYLFSTMKGKYKLISSNIPFVGDTSAKFMNGNTEIILNAPHMSFEMDMNYIDKNLLKQFQQQSANEERNKRNKEASQL